MYWFFVWKIMSTLLCVSIPLFLHGDHVCNESSHLIAIEQYYNDILHCIKNADLQLPRCVPKVRKMYWNDKLNKLKNDLIVAHNFWRLHNCPKIGPIFEAKKNAYYRYKLSICRNKLECNQRQVDSLNENLLSGNHCKFWQSFKYFNYSKGNQSAQINGLTNDTDIANCFARNFCTVYESTNVPQSTKLRNDFKNLYSGYYSLHSNDSINSLLLSWSEMLNVFSKQVAYANKCESLF